MRYGPSDRRSDGSRRCYWSRLVCMSTRMLTTRALTGQCDRDRLVLRFILCEPISFVLKLLACSRWVYSGCCLLCRFRVQKMFNIIWTSFCYVCLLAKVAVQFEYYNSNFHASFFSVSSLLVCIYCIYGQTIVVQLLQSTVRCHFLGELARTI